MIVAGSDLVAGGFFFSAGGIPAEGIARWDGSTWHAFPDQRAGAPDTLAWIGGALYAGGYWSTMQSGILRWSDPNWVSVGSTVPRDDVRALAVFRGQLVAGGDFTNACCGNPPAPGEHIAVFDGTAWQPMGAGLNGTVYALCVFDPDGPGPMPDQLIAGGSFTTAGGAPASGIAAWDGTGWSPLGSGTSGTVRALTVWNGRLVAAGSFYSAGGLVSPGMAFWGCPQPALCYANCTQGTTPPILNVADFTCFLQQFAAGCSSPWPCYPNCDASTHAPFLNVADFTCFLQKFAAGCP